MPKETLFCVKMDHCPICDTPLKFYYYGNNPTYYRGHGHFCPCCGLPVEIENPMVGEFKSCVYCGTSNPVEANFCRNCGKDIKLGGMECGHGWTDLGLSVLWSTDTINKGSAEWLPHSRTPLYYQWMNSRCKRENRRKSIDWEEKLIKKAEEKDGKDVANACWGGKWRTPTKEEFEELISKCKWEKILAERWRTPTGEEFSDVYSKLKGEDIRNLKNMFEHTRLKWGLLKITGPNGNHIIIESTGRPTNFPMNGRYTRRETCFWTSSEAGGVGEDHMAFLFSAIGYPYKEIKYATHKEKDEKILKMWIEEPIEIKITSDASYELYAIRPVMDKE